jgi:surfactin synthase thioesterase subunit
MLSVVGDEDRLARWSAGRDDLWLAAENAPGRVVLSGPEAALRRARSELPALGFTCRPVPVSHPFHSGLMAPVAERLRSAAAGLDARVPNLPMASNLTGTWLDSRYQPDSYWSGHVVSTVRWRDDVDLLLKWEPDIVLELGPGTVLTAFTRKCLEHEGKPGPLPVATMPDAKNPDRDDEVAFLAAIGELWCHGVDLDFAAFHEGEPVAARCLLPTYSFDRTSYWTKPDASIYVEADPVAAPGGSARVPALVRFAARPRARLKLYCFPYAGGNSAAFRKWAQAAPEWLDVVAVEPPRHTGHDDAPVLEHLADAIRSDAGSTSVALCGLSFGASVVLDLLGGPLAGWARDSRVIAVCVVGRAPIMPGAGTVEPPLEEYLMVPDGVRDDAHWRQAVLPLLEADLAFDARAERRIAERREHRGPRVIGCPLQVHCGTEDPSFPGSSAPEWAAVTGSPIVDVHSHPGSHDFMLRHGERIFRRLVGFLDRLAPPDEPDHGRWTGRLHEVRWLPAPAPANPEVPRDIPWTDLDGAGLAASVRFLRDHLSGPGTAAGLLSRLPVDLPPGRHCERFLELLKSLVHAEVRGQLVLILPARDTSGLVTGMTRSLAHEEPGPAVRRVYLDEWPPARHEEWIGRLLRRVSSHPDEADLLHRGGHLLAQRLLPVALPDLPAGTLGATGGSYLVTGGTGGIGRIITDWLIHNQDVEPARVIVSGRTAPDDLRRGVRFLELDFTGPVDPVALAVRTGPLAGIVHLAGALDDGVLRNLDAARFPAVLAPKLALPRLVELGRVTGAPWIAAFSSTSALFGAPGQANYAAANGWVDARTVWSTVDIRPAVVAIDWGTWDDVGMAAGNARAPAASRAGGERPLRSGTALRLFGKLVAAMLSGVASRNFAVCDVDWRRSPLAGRPLVAELPVPGTPDRQAEAVRHPEPHPAAASGAPAPEGDGIQAFLRAYVHRWDESKRLVELGLDSLDFARMRGDFARLFGKDVPLAAIAKPDQRLGELYAFLSEY